MQPFLRSEDDVRFYEKSFIYSKIYLQGKRGMSVRLAIPQDSSLFHLAFDFREIWASEDWRGPFFSTRRFVFF